MVTNEFRTFLTSPKTLRRLIKYDLPKDAQVKLAIYNILGQQVYKLVDEPQKAGFQEVELSELSW